MNIVIKYKGYGDFWLLKAAHKADLSNILSSELLIMRDAQIQAKHGDISKVPLLSHSIESLANTTSVEANIYRAQLINIFNNGFVEVISHMVWLCAVVSEPDKQGVSSYFTVNSSDSEWSWM